MNSVNIHDCEESTVMEFLKNIRRSRFITQNEVAIKMGTTKSNISRLEKSVHSPTLRTFNQYINAIGGVDLKIVLNGE